MKTYSIVGKFGQITVMADSMKLERDSIAFYVQVYNDKTYKFDDMLTFAASHDCWYTAALVKSEEIAS